MSLLQKLVVLSVLTFLKDPSHEENPIATAVLPDLTSINDKMKDLTRLRSCSTPLPTLMQSIHAEGKNEKYDQTVREVASCIEQSRKTLDELTSLVNGLQAKIENAIPMVSEAEDAQVSYKSMDFDLELLEDRSLERKENELILLEKLRKTAKKVRSVDTINMSNSQVFLHFKEGYDLEVVLQKDEVSQYTIESASLVPSYPCFKEAIAYAIKRNDIELLTSETIYALYAHQRLVSEVEELKEKAVIENEDDVHMRAVFSDGSAVRFEVPAIYPNTMGMLTITEVEDPLKKGLQEEVDKRGFSDISGLVEFVYDKVNP